jgi:hypothetical protein
VTAVGLLTATWCLGFAAVSAWQVATGPAQDNRYASYASGLAAVEIVVLVLKLLATALALAAISPGRLGLPVRVTAVGLWGAFGVLALYSAGNLVGVHPRGPARAAGRSRPPAHLNTFCTLHMRQLQTR